MGDAYLALEIGGTKLQIVRGTGEGRIEERIRLVADKTRGAESILAQLEKALEPWAGRTWEAAGIGFGGPIRRDTGRINRSIHVAGWSDFPLCEWLRGLIGPVPVVLENDTNAGALAEARCGAGRGRNPVFYVNNGSGVGGGLVVADRIYHGSGHGEMEFGHLRLDRGGLIVEDRCSGWSLDRMLREEATAHPAGILAALLPVKPGGEALHLKEALAQGDEGAGRVLEEAAAWMGFALSHAVNLIHPETVVLGGGLAELGELWRSAVERALEPWIMEALKPSPPLALSELGSDVVPIGALLLAAEKKRDKNQA